MKVTCPECEKVVPASQVNVATDVAFCPECEEAFCLSELVAQGREADDDSGFDSLDPPKGCRFEDSGYAWKLMASTRSWAAIFLVPFTCVWAGGSMIGIYGTQIAKGEFNLGQSLFGIPFLIGSICLVSLSLMMLVGKVVVGVDGDEGRLFTGVGVLGWRRRFDWGSICAIGEDHATYQSNGHYPLVVVLDGPSRLKFGSMLSEPRREFVLRVLRRKLAERKKGAK